MSENIINLKFVLKHAIPTFKMLLSNLTSEQASEMHRLLSFIHFSDVRIIKRGNSHKNARPDEFYTVKCGCIWLREPSITMPPYTYEQCAYLAVNTYQDFLGILKESIGAVYFAALLNNSLPVLLRPKI